MTSPAIKLAKECWHAIVRMPTSETTSEWYPAPASVEEIETFYAKAQAQAQAQALRDAAETLRCDFRDFDAATLYRMAADLESKA